MPEYYSIYNLGYYIILISCILQIAGDIQWLDILLSPEERSRPTTDYTDLENISIINKATTYFKENNITNTNLQLQENIDQFYETVTINKSDVDNILEKTEGQSSNKLWHTLRKGLITASNFSEACHVIDKDRLPSKTLMKKIMGKNVLDEHQLPPSLKWGRKKESIARILYGRILKKQHSCKSIMVREVGLLMSEKYPAFACSADGIALCKCRVQHIKKLVEIKCPYSIRENHPKDVTLQNQCFLNKLNNKWEVSKECPYFAQIQGQLGLYELDECDLVYTQKREFTYQLSGLMKNTF